MENKKSQGHIEVIFSMVLFIAALISIFVFMNSFPKSNDHNYDLEKTGNIILNNIEGDVRKFVAIIDISNGGTCYNVSSVCNSHFIETDEGGGIYKIYCYENFSGPKSCGSGDKYSIVDYSSEKMVIIEKINGTNGLKKQYETDYNSLKDLLGIKNDFSFSFKYLNGTIINSLSVSKETPKGFERYSEEIPLRAINKTGGIQELILNIKVW
jgi:hypothetical protein